MNEMNQFNTAWRKSIAIQHKKHEGSKLHVCPYPTIESSFETGITQTETRQCQYGKGIWCNGCQYKIKHLKQDGYNQKSWSDRNFREVRNMVKSGLVANLRPKVNPNRMVDPFGV